jgi:hypothetical protein
VNETEHNKRWDDPSTPATMDRWDDLIDRIQKLEDASVEQDTDLAGKVTEIQESLKQLEDSVGDTSTLNAPNIVDGLNTVLDTIKIMQGE